MKNDEAKYLKRAESSKELGPNASTRKYAGAHQSFHE
jgi:hypothetical protein